MGHLDTIHFSKGTLRKVNEKNLTNFAIYVLLWLSSGIIGSILGYCLDREEITWTEFKRTSHVILFGPLVILMAGIFVLIGYDGKEGE